MKRAFIIHGHDTDARDELTKFVEALGFDVRPFFRADERGRAVMILDRVIAGITQADAVLVMFTPDEQAACYEPRTGRYRPRSDRGEELAGWQPRPNVLFEAGIAIGIANEKTALVRLGPVRRISDLDGVLYIDLDEPDAKEHLYHFLKKCDPDLPPHDKRSIADLPGDFSRHLRRRWEYHDELGELEQYLRSVRVGRGRTTFWDVLVEYVDNYPHVAKWSSDNVTDFFYEHYESADNSDDADETNGFFWHLLVCGVLSYKEIEGWDEEELWWVSQQPYVELTSRGWSLLRKIKATTDQPE